jgi:hypothetical protein
LLYASITKKELKKKHKHTLFFYKNILVIFSYFYILLPFRDVTILNYQYNSISKHSRLKFFFAMSPKQQQQQQQQQQSRSSRTSARSQTSGWGYSFFMLLSIAIAVASVVAACYLGAYIHEYRLDSSQQQDQMKVNIDGVRIQGEHVSWSINSDTAARYDISIVNVKMLTGAEYDAFKLSSDPIIMRNAMYGWRAMHRWSLPVRRYSSYPILSYPILSYPILSFPPPLKLSIYFSTADLSGELWQFYCTNSSCNRA